MFAEFRGRDFRIVQVEKKIDRLFARIAGGNEDSSPPDGSSSGRKALWKSSILSPADTVDQHAEALDDDNESNHSLDEVSKLHEFDLSAEDGKGTFQVQVKQPARDDPLSKTMAAQPEAEELFEQYKPMSVSFPFVPITNEMTFESVCVEKPMLLLAIMAVSSWRDKKLQMQFEKQYRTELATHMLRYSLETKLYKMLASTYNRVPQDDLDTADQRYRQLASLSSQLEAGKTFFDTLVAVPTDATHLISFPEWTTVPRMVMDMARLSMSSSSHPPEWNTKEAQDRIRLNLYLDSLCFKMHNMTTYNPPEQPHPDYWTVMKGIMQAVNAWYVRKMKAGSEPRKTHSSTQFGGGGSGADGSSMGSYQGGLGTDSSGSAGYGAPTPGLFDDSSFDFLGSFNPQQGSHCVWLPMDLQMSIDAMHDTDLNW
ncbi:hypothetical protein PRZ48_004262 [Zasmidium cellare]|uniref:Uncharacterized protein n=1 Tax=Zasmidium cellare TaxID=395010 RepID=A0ABR0EPE2_ZASCE|nr:hypothetical protein PRZ48_004262 [Zasmidium cellare]